MGDSWEGQVMSEKPLSDSELLRLCSEATSGPWEVAEFAHPRNGMFPDVSLSLPPLVERTVCTSWIHGQAEAKIFIVDQMSSPFFEGNSPYLRTRLEDAQFIAAARTAMPVLLRRAQEAEAENAALKERLDVMEALYGKLIVLDDEPPEEKK